MSILDVTRRKFLKLLGQGMLALGLSAYVPAWAEASDGDLSIRFLRQIITKDAATSRTLMWESQTPLRQPVVELQLPNQPLQTMAATVTSLTEDDTTNYFYTAELKNLKPATTYTYRIIDGENASNWHTFSTASKDAAFSALLFCDSQCGNSYDTWQETYTKAWQAHPNAAFFADIGDLTDNGQSDWHWRSFWQAMPQLAAHLLVPVMGNHECYGLDWKFCEPKRYLHSFILPSNDNANLQGQYYSFDYGPVHFIVLNTQMLELQSFEPGLLASQLAWLEQDAKTTTKPWRIVLMHKDVLAYDEWQQGTQKAGGFSDAGYAFMKAFDNLGIDLVLTGHMHTYRNRGHIKNFQPADDGPVYVMSGPAGNETYQVPADALDKKSISQPTPPNYLLLSASSQRLILTDYTTDGTMVDRITLEK